jgi:hypothetical protein
MGVLNDDSAQQLIASCVSTSQSRIDFWAEFIHRAQIQRMVEVGVWKGDFAADILQRCDYLKKYYMLDPWRHLADWNKPANQNDATLDSFYEMTKAKTEFAKDRRVILRGKTTEVIDQIKDGELDLAYIDGDHTLKGIAIDLVRVYPKIRTGGFLGGDDFSRTIWSHKISFAHPRVPVRGLLRRSGRSHDLLAAKHPILAAQNRTTRIWFCRSCRAI